MNFLVAENAEIKQGLNVASEHGDANTEPTETMKATIEITARAKAFSSEGIRNHRFQIDGETVRVWDEVAGYFTTCHSLSKSAIRRIRRMA
jgi:hypothetical protein